jgi:hypothetical protein
MNNAEYPASLELSKIYRVLPDEDAARDGDIRVIDESGEDYSIDTIELISGSLPRRQHRLVEAWVELHHDELLANWERLQAGQPPRKINPLQ